MKSGYSALITSDAHGINVIKTKEFSLEKISAVIDAILLKEDALKFKPPKRIKLTPKTGG